MSTTDKPGGELSFSPQFLRILRGMSFRERLRRIIHGLRCASDTGEYRFARGELKRLSAPVMALLVPLLVALVLVTIADRVKPRLTGDPIPIDLRPLDPRPELDKPVEPTPEPSPDPDRDIVVDVDTAVTELPVEFTDTLPTPPVTPVFQTLSPISMRMPIVHSVLGTQRNAGKSSALARYQADPRNEVAVLRALRWLKTQQQPDGSWLEPKAAMTGLALLTFLAHNDLPDSAEFGSTVQRAISWLLQNQESDGRFRFRDDHDYSHPIATYALCEAYGLTAIPMIKPAAEKAVSVIIRGQQPTGGWDYNCQLTARHDLSYSGWCVQALKAADIARLEAPGVEEALVRAQQGIRQHASPEGGFGYTEPGRGALTGVGVLSLQLLGRHRDRAAKMGLRRLAEIASCTWLAPNVERPLYHWYYATQAFFHAGNAYWSKWNDQFSSELIENQIVVVGAGEDGVDIGYWEAPGGRESYGLVYNTTVCALMLQVYYRYLPTFGAPAETSQPDDGDPPVDEIIVSVVDAPASAL